MIQTKHFWFPCVCWICVGNHKSYPKLSGNLATSFDKWLLSYKFLYLGVLHWQLNFHLEIWNHSGGQAKTSFVTTEFLHISSNEVCLILRIFFSFHFCFFFVSGFYHLNHIWKRKTLKFVMDIDCYNLFRNKTSFQTLFD